MFYPNHHIRTYCLYLGSFILNDSNYDMGVYVHPDKTVSHAIVYGTADHEYTSGEFIFQNTPLPKQHKFTIFLCQINEILYTEYLNSPESFIQPAILSQGNKRSIKPCKIQQ